MEQVIRLTKTIYNESVERFKQQGGKVLGYACVATPVELVEAAGMLPLRIRALGNNRTELADAHLSRFNCSFCRACLQLGLDGTYDFLDGLIETNGCDHLRGMFENWQYVRPSPFFHYVKVPHLVNADTLSYFSEELRLFAAALSAHFNVQISDAALWDAIERQDRIRGLLAEVHRLRQAEPSAFNGVEALQLYLAATAAPAEQVEKLLQRVLNERRARGPLPPRTRLLLAGSATDEIEFVAALEDVGAVVAADMLCYGSRAFWTREPGRAGDPYEVLARMYLDNLTCPRMFDRFVQRRDLLIQTVRQARIQGVILVHNKFCDVHGIDNVQLRMALEKLDVPVMTLEKEYGAAADLGRFRTRAQAFLERIGGR